MHGTGKEPLRVGLIGANPDRGWGGAVHVPVLRQLGGFELTAVATTRAESARRSARAFGARHGFDQAEALVAHPEVDVVAIAVKAPDHHRLAMLALQAGKHVYCEWPMAANTDQARQMADLAERRGLRAMVGLQARGAPALLRARALVRDGYVGRVIAVRLRCALPGGGARRSREGAYVIDKANGASTLAIQGGHAIDALCFCTGAFAELSAVVANQFDEVELIETGERRRKDAPDQLLVSGRLADGAVVSVAINGGVAAGYGVAMEIFGDEGFLSVGAAGTLNFQMSPLELRGARLPDRVPRRLPCRDDGTIPARAHGGRPYPGVAVPRATLVNVAALYRELEAAIRHGRRPEPDFAIGLNLHALLDAMVGASDSGRAIGAGWHELASSCGQQK